MYSSIRPSRVRPNTDRLASLLNILAPWRTMLVDHTTVYSDRCKLLKLTSFAVTTLLVTFVAFFAAGSQVTPGIRLPLTALLGIAVGSLLMGLLWNHADQLISHSHANLAEREQLLAELDDLRKAQNWQRTLTELATGDQPSFQQQAQTLANTITNAPDWGAQNFRLSQLSREQGDALALLHTVTNLHGRALHAERRHERQGEALMALWELVGVSQLPGALSAKLLRSLCARLAETLDLEWLTLLAPHADAPLAAVMTAYGGRSRFAMSPSQLQVAITVLTQEQALVRADGKATLACLPILRVGRMPFVIAAYGAADDTAVQSILLLLGTIVAQHIDNASCIADLRAPS